MRKGQLVSRPLMRWTWRRGWPDVLTGYWRSVTVAFIDRVVVLPHLQHVKTLDSVYANIWRTTVDCFTLLQTHARVLEQCPSLISGFLPRDTNIQQATLRFAVLPPVCLSLLVCFSNSRMKGRKGFQNWLKYSLCHDTDTMISKAAMHTTTTTTITNKILLAYLGAWCHRPPWFLLLLLLVPFYGHYGGQHMLAGISN